MKDFKFFKGTLDMMDGDVGATASLHNPFNNNEMDHYCVSNNIKFKFIFNIFFKFNHFFKFPFSIDMQKREGNF